MRVLFVVNADFEFFTLQLWVCQLNPEKSDKSSFRNISPVDLFYHLKCFDDTLYSQQPVTLAQEFNDDDVEQIFMDTLEMNVKEIYKKFKFP